MKADIASPHFPLTPSIEQAVQERTSRLNSHAVDGNRLSVVLDRGGPGRHKVRAAVRGLAQPIVATASHRDMYAAIDKVVDLIDRQWRKRKTARLARRDRRGSLRHQG